MATYIWPPVPISIGAQGTNGSTAPAVSLEVGGVDSSGNLSPISVEAGQVQVDCKQSGFWDIRDITGTVSLPTGAATSAEQITGNNSLASIDGKLPASLGAKNKAGSFSVALATDQEPISVVAQGTVDAGNSSTTPLGAAGVFTGTAIDITNYATVSVLVASDVASATSGFSFQFSNDGTNWDHSHNFDFASGSLSYNISAEAKYFRIVYTNGATPQAHFRLQTVLRREYVMPSQYAVSQAITDYQLGTVTKGVIYGKSTGGGGGYVAVKVNPSGALAADVTGTVAATQSGTWNVNNVSGTVSLPTGAATAALQSSVQGSASGGTAATSSSLSGGVYNSAAPTLTNGQQAGLQLDSSGNLKIAGSITATNSANGNTGSAVPSQATFIGGTDGTNLQGIKVSATGVVSVDGSAVTQPVSGTVAATQSGTWTVEASGRTKANTPTFNDNSSSNITTSAYLQLVASTTSACTAVEVYNQSASSIYFATGGAGSETNQFIIPPGGNGMLPITIASSTRISVKAVDASATSGSLIVNYWG